ncbi:MAG: minor capsid protein [Lachnospiraceae bacterium]
MEELLQKPWRGDDFSSRLWKNQKKLAVSLNNQLLLGLQQGKTTTEIAIAVSNIMRSSFNSAHTLVRTETMHYLNQASMQSYKDAGVKYVQIWAAKDERTCEECGQYHEKIYPIDKCPVLPFHPNCRCTIIPVTDEVDIKKQDLKFNKLDADSELGDRVKNVITKGVSGQLKDFRKGIEHVSNTHVKVLLKQSTDRVEFRRNNKNISSYSQNVVYLSRSASSGTIAHELFHEIDETYGITKSGLLKDTIKQDYEYVNNLARGYGKSIEEMLYSRYPKAFYINDKGRVIAKEEYRGISDILHGISNRKVYLGYGHNRPGYWERNNAVQIETWSQYGRILYESNVDVIKLVKQLFPKTSEDVLLTLERMAK